jgi:hypothetical protein
MATANPDQANGEPREEYGDLKKLLLGHWIADRVRSAGEQTITAALLDGVEQGIAVTLRHFDILDNLRAASPADTAETPAKRRVRNNGDTDVG